LLEVVNLACARGDRPLFRNLSFRLGRGELLHVRGENGSGKTTLLRTLCGLSLPAAGEVRWNGQGIREQPDAYRQQLCYIGHGNAIHGDLTPVENLQFETCLGNDAGIEAKPALESPGLARVANLPTKLLSQGQKRRVALARLAVLKRTLWVLDEPFTALDARAVERLLAALAGHLDRGGLCLLTSHQEVAMAGRPVRTLTLE
jgi:heme exporter protein A